MISGGSVVGGSMVGWGWGINVSRPSKQPVPDELLGESRTAVDEPRPIRDCCSLPFYPC